jgi:hypothetical protein
MTTACGLTILGEIRMQGWTTYNIGFVFAGLEEFREDI